MEEAGISLVGELFVRSRRLVVPCGVEHLLLGLPSHPGAHQPLRVGLGVRRQAGGLEDSGPSAQGGTD